MKIQTFLSLTFPVSLRNGIVKNKQSDRMAIFVRRYALLVLTVRFMAQNRLGPPACLP